MNIRSQLEEYLRPGKPRLVIGAVCGVATLVLAAIALLIYAGVIGRTSKENAVAFNPTDRSLEGTSVYFDVVSLDTYAAHRDDHYYYLATDSEDYAIVVCMRASEEKRFADQQEYWQSQKVNTGEVSSTPKPVRIYGVASKMPDNLVDTLATSYGVSAANLTEKVGVLYIDTMTTPRDAMMTPFIVAAIVAAIFGGILLFGYFAQIKVARRCLDRLDREGATQQAWAELQNYLSTTGGSANPALTANFIVSKKEGAVIAYADIVWIYQHVMRRNFVPVSSNVVCRLRDLDFINICSQGGKGRANVINEVFSAVSARNPAAMIGYSDENVKAFDAFQRQNR